MKNVLNYSAPHMNVNLFPTVDLLGGTIVLLGKVDIRASVRYENLVTDSMSHSDIQSRIKNTIG